MNSKEEEIRWHIIKAMLDEFPTLKEKVKSYLKKKHKTQPSGTPSKDRSIKIFTGGGEKRIVSRRFFLKP